MTTPLDRVKAWSKVCPGRSGYVKYLEGKPISALSAIKAKCAECCAGFQDGKVDCAIRSCPLYPYQPYSSAPRTKKRVSGRQGFRPK